MHLCTTQNCGLTFEHHERTFSYAAIEMYVMCMLFSK